MSFELTDFSSSEDLFPIAFQVESKVLGVAPSVNNFKSSFSTDKKALVETLPHTFLANIPNIS